MKELPRVSIIVPARNAARTLTMTLQSILNQDYQGPSEVVVAEGQSQDSTRALLDTFADGDRRIKVVDNPTGRTPTALNLALAVASGEVIVRCDAHAQLPPSYVSTAVTLLEETGADNVGGAQIPIGSTPLERAIALAMSSPLGAGDARYRLGGAAGPTDTVYLGVFRRAALQRVGGYDESLDRNQDYELNIRLRQTGGTVYFHPDLAVLYRPRASLASLWRQYFEYGRWKRVVVRRHPGSVRWRQLAAPALVVGLGLSTVAWWTPLRRLALVLPATYLATLTFGALWLGIRRREPAAVLIPAVVVVMHVAWGLGFIRGLDVRTTIDHTTTE